MLTKGVDAYLLKDSNHYMIHDIDSTGWSRVHYMVRGQDSRKGVGHFTRAPVALSPPESTEPPARVQVSMGMMATTAYTMASRGTVYTCPSTSGGGASRAASRHSEDGNAGAGPGVGA